MTKRERPWHKQQCSQFHASLCSWFRQEWWEVDFCPPPSSFYFSFFHQLLKGKHFFPQALSMDNKRYENPNTWQCWSNLYPVSLPHPPLGCPFPPGYGFKKHCLAAWSCWNDAAPRLEADQLTAGITALLWRQWSKPPRLGYTSSCLRCTASDLVFLHSALLSELPSDSGLPLPWLGLPLYPKLFACSFRCITWFRHYPDFHH